MIDRLRTALIVALVGVVALGGLALAEEPDEARPTSGDELASRLVAGPLVVIAHVERVGVKATLRIEDVLRGSPPGDAIELAWRGTNLMRPVDSPAFSIDEGETAVFVLAPWVDSRGEQPRPELYRPANGYLSRIPLPREGREALVEAVRSIVAFQDDPDHAAAVSRLRNWALGVNPWLVDVALDQAARFCYATPAWIPALLERANDARPRRRLWTVEAIGTAFARGRFDDRDDAERGLPRLEVDEDVRALRETLVRLARTDEDPRVRRSAVEWVGAIGFDNAPEILRAAAEDDPSQEVRYEAAAALARMQGRISEAHSSSPDR